MKTKWKFIEDYIVGEWIFELTPSNKNSYEEIIIDFFNVSYKYGLLVPYFLNTKLAIRNLKIRMLEYLAQIQDVKVNSPENYKFNELAASIFNRNRSHLDFNLASVSYTHLTLPTILLV